MQYKAFCLVYHGSRSKNREHLCLKYRNIFYLFIDILCAKMSRVNKALPFYSHLECRLCLYEVKGLKGNESLQWEVTYKQSSPMLRKILQSPFTLNWITRNQSDKPNVQYFLL